MSLIAAVTLTTAAYAVPAHPDPVRVEQPDGTYVTLALHGDEFFHYTTTADGYTVERNAEGYWVYLMETDSGEVVQSTVPAHDEADRTDEERELLDKVGTNLLPQGAVEDAKIMKAAANEGYTASDAITARPKTYDYSKFHGLVILAEFNDLSFSRSDAQEIFYNMMSQKDYAGVPDTTGTSVTSYTGSVRDYFYNSSFGVFDPTFDVVGPIKVDCSCLYANGTTNGHRLARIVLDTADDSIDFSQYDCDGDGTLDMFYIIYAGYGSNYTGNDSGYIWPYASSFSGLTKDGVSIGRYACSVELYGYESGGYTVLEGIGTVCHEFSHVLGLVDEYDTDYSSSGGESAHPDTWSLMASGSYLNYGRTPPSYSLFERYQSGFTTPTVITANGEYTIRSLDEYNEGYRIDSSVDNEYFMLENRRATGWNACLPGSGMLVFRVDSTSTSVWTSNKVNCNPDHMYYELIRADAQSSGDTSYDPFPGTGKVKKLTNSTDPSIQSWTGADTPYELLSITEQNSIITIVVGQDESVKEVEDFEKIATFTGDASSIEGVFTTWDFSGANVVSVSSSEGNGSRAGCFYKYGYMQSQGFKADYIESVSFTGWNNNTLRNATVHLYVSTDYGSTWTEYFEEDAVSASALKSGNTNVTFTYPLGIYDTAVMLKIYVDGSLGSYYITLDDITIVYTGTLAEAGIETVTATAAEEQLSIATSGLALTVFSTASDAIEIYGASGSLVDTAPGYDGAITFELPKHGFYIIRQGAATRKVVL